jgi:hypothetical protein
MGERTDLELIVDNELRNELGLKTNLVNNCQNRERAFTYKAKHIHEGCKGRDNEAVPSPMGLVDERIDGVSGE